MQHPRRIAFLLTGLLLGITLCGLLVYALDYALGPGALRADVAEVLQRSGIATPELSCRMISRTRTGDCLTNLDQPTIARLIQQLQLTQITPSDGEPLAFPQAGPDSCRASAVFGSDAGISAYLSMGEPAQLSLRNGSRFAYLLLLTRAETGQACIEVAYAYG